MKLRIIGLLFFIVTGSFTNRHEPTARELFMKMIQAAEKMEGGRWTLCKKERLRDGKEFTTEVIAKLKCHPFKVYLYSIKPNPGTELLYAKGWNNGKILIHPNRFPYVNLSVNLNNQIMRENQHHAITEMGFEYITSVLKYEMAKNEKFFFANLTYEGEVDWDKKKMHKLSGVNPDFNYETYTVQPGENILSIAKKLYVNEYMILSLNKKVSDYSDVKAGQNIIVPNSYAKRIVLYIDKFNFLPLVQMIYDEKGFYEQYEFKSMVLNPVYKPDEFTPQFKEYGF